MTRPFANPALSVLMAVALMLALLAPGILHAQGSRSYEVTGENHTARFRHPLVPEDWNGVFSADSSSTIKWDALLKMDLLYGEPVFSTKFRYEVQAWSYILPNLGQDKFSRWSDMGVLTGEGTLPADAPRARPYDVKLAFRFRVDLSNRYVEVIQDVGAPGKPGEWSFNVPGSPNWNRTFISDSSPGKGEWLNEAQARKVWKSRLDLAGVRVVSSQWSSSEVMDYINRNNMFNRTMATIEAINRLLDGVGRSYGYDVTGQRPSKERYARPKFRESVPLELLRQLERLQNLPEKLKEGDDTAYEQAKAEAEDIVAVMEEDIASYEDKTPRPEDLPKGSELIVEEDGLQPVFAQLPLDFELIDHASEDGDRVLLRVRDSSGEVMREEVSLRNAGTRFTPPVRAGSIRISIEALNEGRSGLNTGTIRVHSRVTKGLSTQEYSLRTGETGTLPVFAPPQ